MLPAILLLLTLNWWFVPIAMATDFSSANFTVKDPVLFPAGFSSSNSFRVFSVIGQSAIGVSTSSDATLNTLKAGFLYFPEPAAAAAPAGAAAPAAVRHGEARSDAF